MKRNNKKPDTIGTVLLNISSIVSGCYVNVMIYLKHLLPPKAATILQYSQAPGFPYLFK